MTRAPNRQLLWQSWQRMWSGLGASGDGAGGFDDIVRRYSESHRRYHTLQHLCECLASFERVRELAIHAAELEAAVWFHDAIYDPKRNDNEARSAELAHSLLQGAGVPHDSVARIEMSVLATRHAAPADSVDQQLLVDIDLVILAADVQRFDEYEQQVRDEYQFVAGAVFRQKRRALLESLLARPRIYGTARFHAALEQRARANLRRALADLLRATRASA